MTVGTALQQGTKLLEEARIPVPRLTSEVLLCHALQRDKPYLYAHAGDELSELGWIHFGRYLHQRLAGKPTQYITHRQEFYGRDFYVNAAVLIPRPETEHVVETALRFIQPDSHVIDVGCGSGAIAVSLSCEARIPVLACDISPTAIQIARRNATEWKAPVNFHCGDLLASVKDSSLDIVASNPPYVSWRDKDTLQREVRDFEPEVALYGGEQGYEMYQRLITDCERVLRPGGRFVFELGYRSLEPVQSMVGSGWSEVEVVHDLAGYPRVLTAKWQ